MKCAKMALAGAEADRWRLLHVMKVLTLAARIVPEVTANEGKNENFNRALDGGAPNRIRSRRSIQHRSLCNVETGGRSARNHMESCGDKRKQTRGRVLPSRNKNDFRPFGGVRQMQSANLDKWLTTRWSGCAA
jgi:hypothetical protein